MGERSTTLNFTAAGGSPTRAVTAIQAGSSFMVLETFIPYAKDTPHTQFYNTVFVVESNGVLTMQIDRTDFADMMSNHIGELFFGAWYAPTATTATIYSTTSGKTFTLEKVATGVFAVNNSVRAEILNEITVQTTFVLKLDNVAVLQYALPSWA